MNWSGAPPAVRQTPGGNAHIPKRLVGSRPLLHFRKQQDYPLFTSAKLALTECFCCPESRKQYLTSRSGRFAS
jgi:hypothetical protein